nr:ATP synthase F0 subunit 8 [Homoderus mellyi]
MPQMAPMSWLTLMILFSFLLLLMSVINFSSSTYQPLSLHTLKIKSSKIWKW